MFIIVDFCFLVKRGTFQLLSDFLRTGRALIFLVFLSFSPQTPFQSSQLAFLKLTFLHSQGIRNLNALACLPKNAYLCIGNGRKGSISRMSDECLMKQEMVVSFYTQYQAVMRKFTLAWLSSWCQSRERSYLCLSFLYNPPVFLLRTVVLIFTAVKKLKPCGSNRPPLYYSLLIFRF